jgi:hypothetical protein
MGGGGGVGGQKRVVQPDTYWNQAIWINRQMLHFIIERREDEISTRISAVLDDKICGLPQSLETYVRTVIQMMPWLLPYTYCTLHYSLTTLLFDTIIVSTFEMWPTGIMYQNIFNTQFSPAQQYNNIRN